MTETIQIQKVINGFIVSPVQDLTGPRIFVTLLEALTFAAEYFSEYDAPINRKEVQLSFTPKEHHV